MIWITLESDVARNLRVLMCLSALVVLTGCAGVRQKRMQAKPAANVVSLTVTGRRSKSDEKIRLVAHAEPSDLSDQPSKSTGQTEAIQPPPFIEYDDATSVPTDVESLVSMALATNPAIQEARAALCAARGIHVQVGLKPNPRIGYFAQEIGNDGAAGQHGAFVSQTLVRGNKLARNRDVVSKEIQQLRWQLESQRRRIETDVRVYFYASSGESVGEFWFR